MVGADEGLAGAPDLKFEHLDRLDAVLDRYHSMAGEVDDGPNAWAVSLAAAIVSLAIALAILTEGLI